MSDARAAGHHALIVRACESRRQTKVRPPRTFCARCIQASVFFHLPLALTQPPPPSCTGCAGVCLSLYVRQIRVRAPGNRMHVNIIFCIYIILYVNIYNIIYIYILGAPDTSAGTGRSSVSRRSAPTASPRCRRRQSIYEEQQYVSVDRYVNGDMPESNSRSAPTASPRCAASGEYSPMDIRPRGAAEARVVSSQTLAARGRVKLAQRAHRIPEVPPPAVHVRGRVEPSGRESRE